MKSSKIQPRPGDQGGEADDEVQRFQHDMGRAIMKRLFVAVHDPARPSTLRRLVAMGGRVM